MKTIDLEYVTLTFIDDKTVLVEAKYGVEITGEDCPNTHEIIEKEMSADYGMIINRKEDYSIAPLQVYNVLNGFKRLKAIAIVNHKARTAICVETEQKLFRGQLEDFTTVDAARSWLDDQLAAASVR